MSYLEIEPLPTPTPFALKRSHGACAAGTIFVRKGSSTVAISPAEASYLVPVSEAEYLDGNKWRTAAAYYLSSGSQFEQAANIPPLFEPRVRDQERTALDVILEHLGRRERVIVVTGQAGQGKTVVLMRVAYALARRLSDVATPRDNFGDSEFNPGEDYIVHNVVNELETAPAWPVPLFMTLRSAFETRQQFENHVLHCAQQIFGAPSLRSLNALFKVPGSRWILLLDGLDELRNREQFAPQLRAWVEELPDNVQVVITSRPRTMPQIMGVEVPLAPLTTEEILNMLRGKLVAASPEDGERIFVGIEDWIRRHPHLLAFIARPRALNAFAKYLSGDTSTPFLVEVDRERVEALPAPAHVPPRSGEGDIPIISPDGEGDEDGEDSKDYEDGESGSEAGSENNPADDDQWVAPEPEIVVVLQAIIDHMHNEEVKRVAEWGSDAREIIERAHYQLEKVAWNIDWSKDEFNPMYCEGQGWLDKRNLHLNEDIGFVERFTLQRYGFICTLFRRFLAASFAFAGLTFVGLDPDAIKKHAIKQDVRQPATRAVLGLINDLLRVHGQVELAIPKEIS